jgi:hypothetical protein
LREELQSAWPREATRAIRFPEQVPLRWRRRLARSKSPGLTARPGVTVALLAPDGAGKSTAIARLRHTIPLPVRTLYMGLYSREHPIPGAPLPGIGTLVRLMRQWRGYLLGRQYRRRGDVVLFDRYCHDARLRQGQGPWFRRVRTWMLGHACPTPDLTVVLDAPGELLHSRKPEHDAAELEQRRQGYLALARRFGWLVVDASQQQQVVERQLEREIWAAYAAGMAQG